MKMGPRGFPEMSVTNYQSRLHNNPEEQRKSVIYGAINTDVSN